MSVAALIERWVLSQVGCLNTQASLATPMTHPILDKPGQWLFRDLRAMSGIQRPSFKLSMGDTGFISFVIEL